MTFEIKPGRADELGRNAAGDDLLFLDDLGVEVGAERAGDRVGDVDAVEVVDVVGRDAERRRRCRCSSCPSATPGCRSCCWLVGHDARHQLQVALVAAAGRQRLGELQRDVLAGRRRSDVDERRARRRPAPLRSDPATCIVRAERRRLSRADQDLVARLSPRSPAARGHWCTGSKARALRARGAGGVGHDRALGDRVGRLGRHGDAWQPAAVLVCDDDLNGAGGRDLREC